MIRQAPVSWTRVFVAFVALLGVGMAPIVVMLAWRSGDSTSLLSGTGYRGIVLMAGLAVAGALTIVMSLVGARRVRPVRA